MEARGFRDAIEAFGKAGCKVVGISTDSVESQSKFAEKQGLDYPVLSDRGGTVARAYGVRGWLGFAKRVSFLIDPEGRIARVYPKVSPSKHAEEVLTDLRASA